jgi:hypothetical protein
MLASYLWYIWAPLPFNFFGASTFCNLLLSEFQFRHLDEINAHGLGVLLLLEQSKWLVVTFFGAVILGRHDAKAMWAALGLVVNSILSVILKRTFNQERPDSTLRSDPGMPSSHGQSIFFTLVFAILSGNVPLYLTC